MYKIKIKETELVLEKEFKTVKQAEAYASSKQVILDHPDLPDLPFSLYEIIKETN